MFVVETFLNQVVSRHGILLEVHMDQGNFESRIFQELSTYSKSRRREHLLLILNRMVKWNDNTKSF